MTIIPGTCCFYYYWFLILCVLCGLDYHSEAFMVAPLSRMKTFIHQKQEKIAVPSTMLLTSSSSSSSESTNNHNQDADDVTNNPSSSSFCECSCCKTKASRYGPPSKSPFPDDTITDAQVHAWLSQSNAPRQPKRSDYLSWDDTFMATAILSSQRSKDPSTRGGACIVHATTRRILAVGYTGFPRAASDDVLPWTYTTTNDNTNNNNNQRDPSSPPWLWTPEPYVVHATVNAILNKAQNDIRGSTLYVTQFPCHECVKLIIQAGIRRVVYKRVNGTEVVSCTTSTSSQQTAAGDETRIQASRIMLHLAGVQVQTYQPDHSGPIHISLRVEGDDDNDNNNLQQQGTNTATTHNDTFTEESVNKTPDSDDAHKHRSMLMNETRGYDPVVQSSGKRTKGVLTWSDYFMAMARLTARRSKDPNTQVGACLVDEDTQRIVGLGYNGLPAGCSDDVLPWTRTHGVTGKYMYVTHAEANAILNRIATPSNAAIYVDLFPCHACAKLLVQAGIQKVVYQQDKYHDTDSCRASRIVLTMANVELVKYQPATEKNITISLQ